MQQAEDALRRAADTDDAGLKSSAYFNLGNTFYQREQWDDAIAAYKRALRADTKNDAARNNLEMALRQRQKDDPKSQPRKGQDGQKGQDQKDKKDQSKGKGQGDKSDQKGPDDPPQGEPDPSQQGQPGQDGQRPPDQDPQDGQRDPRQGQDPGQGGQGGEPDRQPGQQGKGRADRQRDGQRHPTPSDPGDSMDGSPSDQERKLDELERRSRELRKRLLRQGDKDRDPMKLPSRRDW
jgi:Ca-activated chloride channel family protein